MKPLSPKEELELLELEALAAGAKRPLGREVAATLGTGAERGASALLGMPADIYNLITQELPKTTRLVGLPQGAPIGPKMPGGSDFFRDQIRTHIGEAEYPETFPGKVGAAAIAGGIGGAGSKISALVGALSGALGEGVYQATDSTKAGTGAAALIAALPFLFRAGWQGLRPRRAEHTARDALRNVTREDFAAARGLDDQFSQYGGRVLPGQGLPEHTQLAGLSESLAGRADGKALVDALLAQQAPREAMRTGVQAQANQLFASADRVRPTRAAQQALIQSVRGTPASLGVPPTGPLAREAGREVQGIVQTVQGRPTARQLSVLADSLASRRDYVPGLGPLYPALARQVGDTARTAAPAVGQADALIRRTRDLERAIDRVRIPPSSQLADANRAAIPQNAVIAAGATATGHPLVATGAISRIARGIVTGNPEKKLAEALADPTMKKLRELAKSSALRDVPPELLRAEIQAEIQRAREK